MKHCTSFWLLLLLPCVFNLLEVDTHKLYSSPCPAGCVCQSDIGLVSCQRLNLTSTNELPEFSPQLAGSVIHLDLSHNSLSDLNFTRVSSVLSNLDSLTVRYNQMTVLPRVIGIPSLNVLDVSENLIASIADDAALTGLLAMERLDMSHNMLAEIPDKAIGNLRGLMQLNLRHNQLKTATFGEGMQNMENLHWIALAENDISQLNDTDLKNLQNSNVTYLDLSYCSLVNISGAALEPTSGTLDELGLTGNVLINQEQLAAALTNLESLSTLSLGSTKLQQFAPALVETLDTLQHLQSLNISDNWLSALDLKSTTISRLRTLNISDNFLDSIPASLRGADQLVELYVSRNKFEFGKAEPTLNISTLQVLMLDDNNLSELGYGFLSGLTSLFSLDLRNNQISTVEENAFVDLRALQILIIGNNSLAQHTIQPALNKLSAHLAVLDLSGNRIQSPTTQFLANFIDLAELSLSNADVSTWPVGWLKHSKSLELLKLDHNNISTINESMWTNTVTFTSDSREAIKVNLDNNPFRCRCDLRWFTNWLRENQYSEKVVVSDVEMLRCSNKTELTLLEYKPTDSECPSTGDDDRPDSAALITSLVLVSILTLVTLAAGCFYYAKRRNRRSTPYEIIN